MNPSGKGSVSSTTYWAIPVIQPVPLRVGTTAGIPPTSVSSTSSPVHTVPMMLSWRNSSPRASSPLACITAIFAQVPVPHGERSKQPFQLSGRSQLGRPVDTVTALRRCASPTGGPESCEIDTPPISGVRGCSTESCSAAATRSISPTRVIRPPFSGRSSIPS